MGYPVGYARQISVMSNQEIKITGEFTADPNICRFVIDRPVLKEWTINFKSAEDSKGSPLVDRLFAIDGISEVRVGGNTITINKTVDDPWPKLAKEIGSAIRTSLSDDVPPISEAAVDAVRSAPLDDMAEVIEKLFEEHINPALASHGGFVRLVKVVDRDVHLEMGGGCQGCSASKITLKHGIENAVREAVPQVREVVDVTDHASGENPYYS